MANYDTIYSSTEQENPYLGHQSSVDTKYTRVKGMLYTGSLNKDSVYNQTSLVYKDEILPNTTLDQIIKSGKKLFTSTDGVKFQPIDINQLKSAAGISSGGKRKTRKYRKGRRSRKTKRSTRRSRKTRKHSKRRR
jgi:hypothetical protein